MTSVHTQPRLASPQTRPRMTPVHTQPRIHLGMGFEDELRPDALNFVVHAELDEPRARIHQPARPKLGGHVSTL
ncbi:hypothetical protein Hamer_G010622 [Homarus americanus]|uniref:Uncharacterized protein n=1 Tax=Homarus americanus TaxID=6706 RepID=A0A8J5JCL8_HOMAM|nr:hypothetical protein Hamer_G010622 [Homarus americanus]